MPPTGTQNATPQLPPRPDQRGDDELLLWEALADATNLILRQLADLHARQHSPRMERGLRWLARHGKMPSRRGHATSMPTWGWLKFEGTRQHPDHWRLTHLGTSYLPVDLAEQTSMIQAVVNAAWLMGEFLERHPECAACLGTGWRQTSPNHHPVPCNECGGCTFMIPHEPQFEPYE